MNKKTLITLEYNKIISALVSMACSDGARQTLKALVPMNNIDDINALLMKQTMLSQEFTRKAA